MKRLNTNVRAFDSPLQQAPKVFEFVGMNVAIYVRFGVVDNLVRVVCVKAIVGFQRVGEYFGADLNALANLLLNVFLPASSNYGRANLASIPVQQSEHDSLTHGTATLDVFHAPVSVHVPCLAADERFVRFD